MFPFIREDDFILVKRVPINTIMPGDIILFESEDKKKVCHNVSQVKKINDVLWFHTKGYKSASCDSVPIMQDRILGKAVALKRRNKIFDLTAQDTHSFRFYFDCFVAEYIFYVRSSLARIPWLRKVYRCMRDRMTTGSHCQKKRVNNF